MISKFDALELAAGFLTQCSKLRETRKICASMSIEHEVVGNNYVALGVSFLVVMFRTGIGLSLCRGSIALHQKQTFGLTVADAVSVHACLCFFALDRRKDNLLLSETFKLLQRCWEPHFGMSLCVRRDMPKRAFAAGCMRNRLTEKAVTWENVTPL